MSLLVYTIRIESERLKIMKKESIFKVTFTNDSTVFIQAMDEEHAKRIVERNGTEWLSAELTVEMIIKSIEECE